MERIVDLDRNQEDMFSCLDYIPLHVLILREKKTGLMFENREETSRGAVVWVYTVLLGVQVMKCFSVYRAILNNPVANIFVIPLMSLINDAIISCTFIMRSCPFRLVVQF